MAKHYGFEWILLNRRVNFKMPNLGYAGGGANFPVMWWTWRLNIGKLVTFGHIAYRSDDQIALDLEKVIV